REGVVDVAGLLGPWRDQPGDHADEALGRGVVLDGGVGTDRPQRLWRAVVAAGVHRQHAAATLVQLLDDAPGEDAGAVVDHEDVIVTLQGVLVGEDALADDGAPVVGHVGEPALGPGPAGE